MSRHADASMCIARHTVPESEKQCRIMRKEYEAIPNDGDWKHIEYICKPVKAKYAT